MKPKGFTLVEIIIYIALLALFFVAVIRFLLAFMAAEQKSMVIQEVGQNANIAMQRMVQEIRTASDINTGSSTFGVHPGVISLADDTPANDPTVFDVSGGALRIKQGSGTAYSLTSNKVTVTNFVIYDRSVSGRTKNLRLSLTLEWATPGSVEYQTDITITGTAVVRSRED